jgi:phosphoserine/homoserine phosphotransferase
MRDHKREAVKALKALNFEVYAVGDSYNDVSMLMEADVGIFFRASTNVIQKFPELPFTTEYNQLKKALIEKNLFRKDS